MFGLIGGASPFLSILMMAPLLMSLYDCAYSGGAADAEAANLRATIEESEEARERAREELARVETELAWSREASARLRDHVEALGGPGMPTGADCECGWDDTLPWPE